MEIDPGILAELDQREARVEIDRQIVGRDLIENRRTAALVRILLEPPNEVGEIRASVRDRIAHRDPRRAAHVVHHEAVAALRKQKSLVADERQLRGDLRRRTDDGLDILHLGRRNVAPLGRNLVHHLIGRDDDDNGRRTERGAQEPRRVLMIREFPPQRVVVGNAAIDRETDKRRRADGNSDGKQRRRRRASREHATLAIEFPPSDDEQTGRRKTD